MQRKRDELKGFFKKNTIPTEENFADLIDSTLNLSDDNVFKQSGNPLLIVAEGDERSEKTVLQFGTEAGQPYWWISLNPVSTDDPQKHAPGLSISDGPGNSRLFIAGDMGLVGINTNTPQVHLDVNGAFRAHSIDSGERSLLFEGPSSAVHHDPDKQTDEYKTGLVLRVKNTPPSEAPIFQVRSSGQYVRLFADHDGWTGSRRNSAWFGGDQRLNYFRGKMVIGEEFATARENAPQTLNVYGYVAARTVYFSAYVAHNRYKGVHDRVPLEHVHQNVGNGFDPSKDKWEFTAPVAGVYLFTLTLLTGLEGRITWTLKKRDARSGEVSNVNQNDKVNVKHEDMQPTMVIVTQKEHSTSRTVIADLNAGDKVWVRQWAQEDSHPDNFTSGFEGVLLWARTGSSE